jgi:sensor domain CHASE-containing protein
MNAEQIAPIVLLLALAIVGVFYLHYRHRTRAQVQETIRSAISQGTQLT